MAGTRGRSGGISPAPGGELMEWVLLALITATVVGLVADARLDVHLDEIGNLILVQK